MSSSLESNETDSSSILILPSLQSNDGNETLTLHALSNNFSCVGQLKNVNAKNEIKYTHEKEGVSIEYLPSVLTTNPEKECEVLENRVEKLLVELKEYKEENFFLKNQCQFLKIKLEQVSLAQCKNDENMTNMTNENDNSNKNKTHPIKAVTELLHNKENKVDGDYAKNSNSLAYGANFCSMMSSPDMNTYVDVNEMLLNEKLKNFLFETNKELTDKTKLCKSMHNLIENIFILIERQFKSTETQKLRDELLNKINDYDKDSKIKEINQTKEKISMNDNQADRCSINKLSLSLNDELASCKNDAKLLKIKIVEQNELIKKLINEISSSKSKSNPSSHSTTSIELANKKQDSLHISEPNSHNDYETLSPGTSPSSFLMKFYEKRLKHRLQQSHETQNALPTDSVKSNNNLTSQTSKQEANSKTENQKNDSGDNIFLYNLNGFIAIDRTLEYGSELNDSNNNEGNDVQSKIRNEAQSSSKNASNYNDNDDSNLFMITCPKCTISIDSRDIPLNIIEDHLINCDLNKYNVCMFCLTQFDKQNNHQLANHIENHLTSQQNTKNFYY